MAIDGRRIEGDVVGIRVGRGLVDEALREIGHGEQLPAVGSSSASSAAFAMALIEACRSSSSASCWRSSASRRSYLTVHSSVARR